MAGESGAAATLYVGLELESKLQQELDQELAAAKQKTSAFPALGPELAKKFETLKARAELTSLNAKLLQFQQSQQGAATGGQQFQVNLKSLGRETQLMSRGVSAMGSSLLGVQMVLASLGGSFGEAEKTVMGASGAMITIGGVGSMLSTELKAMSAAITGSLIPALQKLAVTMYAALGPWGLLAVGVAAVITAYIAYTKWSEIAANRTETLSDRIERHGRVLTFLGNVVDNYNEKTKTATTQQDREASALQRVTGLMRDYNSTLEKNKSAKEELADIPLALEGDELAIIRANQRLREVLVSPESTPLDIAEAQHAVRVAQSTKDKDKSRKTELEREIETTGKTMETTLAAAGVTTPGALSRQVTTQEGKVVRMGAWVSAIEAGKRRPEYYRKQQEYVNRADTLRKQWAEKPLTEADKAWYSSHYGPGTPEYEVLREQGGLTPDTSIPSALKERVLNPGQSILRQSGWPVEPMARPNPNYMPGFSQGGSQVIVQVNVPTDASKEKYLWEHIGEIIGDKVREVLERDNRASGLYYA